jgi:hypothetical protein
VAGPFVGNVAGVLVVQLFLLSQILVADGVASLVELGHMRTLM